MNYLAHLALSREDPALMTGNFIADDMPRKEEVLIPQDIKAGITLHRQIDDFTDSHPAFLAAVERLRPKHRKYAPVVLDILNDHLLSRTWHQFFSRSEQSFHKIVYSSLESNVKRLPPKTSLHVHALLEYQYLKAYGYKTGLKDVLDRMDRRTRFPSDFGSAVNHLYDDYHFFEQQFQSLFSDLLTIDSAGL